jgi:hypothetical protein
MNLPLSSRVIRDQQGQMYEDLSQGGQSQHSTVNGAIPMASMVHPPPSSLSFPHPGQLGAGSGPYPTATGFLTLCKMTSDWGLSVLLVLRPSVSYSGCLCVPGILRLVAA